MQEPRGAGEGPRDVLDGARLLTARAPPRRAAYDGGMDDFWMAAAWSILPTIVVSVVFFFVLRGIIRSDRTERQTHARIEAEERAARGLPPRAP